MLRQPVVLISVVNAARHGFRDLLPRNGVYEDYR